MIQFDVREPDKKRFLDAVNHVESAELPYNEYEFHPSIVSAVLGKEVQTRSYLMPIEDIIQFIKCVGIDMCNLAYPWWLGRERYVDEDGMERYSADGNIRSRDDFSRLTPIDLDQVSSRIENLLSLIDGTNIGWTMALPTPPSIIVSAMGFYHYYVSIYDDPDFLLEFISRVEEHIYPMTELVLKYRPDEVRMGAFLCGKNGLMMNSELTERFILEPMDRHMSIIRPSGIPALCHSDGNCASIMDRFIEIGFSIFHPNEICEGFDIYESKKKWGDRIALAGNIDVWAVLTNGTPEQVREDTLRHLEGLSAGGGYICGSSHDISEDIPLENLRAMTETVAGYRRNHQTS